MGATAAAVCNKGTAHGLGVLLWSPDWGLEGASSGIEVVLCGSQHCYDLVDPSEL